MLAPISARRYAQALFDLALEKGKLEVVKADLEALERLQAGSPELAAILASPVLLTSARLGVLDALLKGRADELTLRFLRFLESKRRLGQIAPISQIFHELWLVHSGILEVEVVSAIALEADQLIGLKARLAQRFHKQIEARVSIDPGLVGGFLVKVGDEVLDFSVRSQLQRFEQHILSA
jgi:F-type H+-transporting ATPase subunit delta